MANKPDYPNYPPHGVDAKGAHHPARPKVVIDHALKHLDTHGKNNVEAKALFQQVYNRLNDNTAPHKRAEQTARTLAFALVLEQAAHAECADAHAGPADQVPKLKKEIKALKAKLAKAEKGAKSNRKKK